MPSRSPSSPTSPSTRAAGNVAPAAATGTGLSRRSFLLNTVLAAAAAPWLVPAGVVRAQDGRPTPSNRTT
ncbi:MAG: hypothetical protein LBR07_04315, partial [Puniceicoccales bacterium]|nr:hypothetical protein [Puniceicoccales bacterium]